ncbi:MAG: alpha/beta hydrolase [Azospirillaceae bacterium]|nr:alpha/beta hydrolase [Azospirillaceae bacterium]
MAYANSKGTQIYYETHGGGPAILFVHGSGGHHVAWYRQVAYLSQWYKVVTVDLRGFGNSDPVEGGPDSLDFVDDIEAVLAAADINRCAILGQSIGAAPALRLALRRPDLVSGVILAHSVGGISDPELATLVKANRHEAEKLPVIDRLLTPQFQSGQPALKFLFQQMGTFNHAKMQDLRNLQAQGPTAAEVAASGVGIHFLAGERDAVLRPDTVRQAHRLLPASTLTIVPNGPHSLYWEMPDVFNAAVHQILKQVYPETAS